MKISIRKFRIQDTKEAAKLILKTYGKFCSGDATEEANLRYLTQYDTRQNKIAELEKKFRRTKISFVAVVNNSVIGVIRGDEKRIWNLFVNGNYHRRGVAKSLVETFEKEAKKHKAKKIKIIASLYSVPFYVSVGYKKTTGIRNYKGIKVQPMKKVL